MAPVLTSRRLPLLVALGAVLFAFWPALFGGGSLVSDDLVATAPPFDSHRPENFSLENGPGDPVNIHAHWASLAADIRSGEVGWWNPDLAAGQPTMKAGAPIFDLPYLFTPAWYSPGLVAAVRALTAIALSMGFLRAVGLHRTAALAGGLAFGFSGFMVGWMNWPQSSVAALAPGLLWAIERMIVDPRRWRVVPLGVVVGLMVWANFPSVLIYVLLGVSLYTLVRLAAEVRAAEDRPRWLRARVGLGAAAAVLALLLAGPHLIGFSQYVDWADTSHRIGNPDDSSAGLGYLLTAVAPAIWGSDAVGEPWFGQGNWVEFNTHLGASVVLLALLGFVAGFVGADTRQRSVIGGLALVTVTGVLIAYIGGPLGVALGDLTGSQGGLMTRAKVLISLGVALGAAFGVQWLAGDRTDRRRELWLTTAIGGVAVLVMVPSTLDWLDAARSVGAVRPSLAASSASGLGAVAVVALVVARVRGVIDSTRTGWAIVVVVAVELLAFAMPVPTIVSREERLAATPAHEVVQSELAPGERLAGEGRTFFPSTTQLFDIADARGQLLKSPGYQALLRAVDPDMLRREGGGTPTYPNIARGTDIASPIWDVLSVGLWAQFPDSVPPGTRLGPPRAAAGFDPHETPLTGETTVPDGGLRAVVIEIAPALDGFIDVAISTAEGTTTERRWVGPGDSGTVSFAVLGEHLVVGSSVSVAVSAPAATMLVGVDDAGAVVVGTIAGDDEYELLRVGDVILLDRPVEPVRLVSSVEVIESPSAAAAAIVESSNPDWAVVDRGSQFAVLDDPVGVVQSVDYGRGRVAAVVEMFGPSALLVVSEANYPGWTVTVNGEVADLVTADAAFLGVVLTGPGVLDVEFLFTPEHLGRSTLMLVLGTVLIVVLLVDGVRRGDLRFPQRGRG